MNNVVFLSTIRNIKKGIHDGIPFNIKTQRINSL